MGKWRSQDSSRFISGTTSFLIIHDLPDNLTSNPKLFADDTLLFSVINYKHSSENNSSFIKYNTISQSVTQKYLGMFLDTKLNFQGRTLKSILNKVNKRIGLLPKLHNTLPRLLLLTIYIQIIYKTSGDIIYDQANVSFHQKLESIQCNSALAIRGTLRGTSTEEFYDEVGLKTRKKRRWYRKLYSFYKGYKSHSPKYLFNIIPVTVRRYNTRNTNNIPQFKTKHDFFEIHFSLLRSLNGIKWT